MAQVTKFLLNKSSANNFVHRLLAQSPLWKELFPWQFGGNLVAAAVVKKVLSMEKLKQK